MIGIEKNRMPRDRFGNFRIFSDLLSVHFALQGNIVFQSGKKHSDLDSIKISSKIWFTGFESGFGKSILEYSRVVNYFVLPIPSLNLQFDHFG